MSFPLPFVLATGNADKAREILEILVDRSDHPVVAWAMTIGSSTYAYLLDTPEGIAETVEQTPAPTTAPDVTETGATLEENARIKALALAEAIGVLAIADDSGLEVDALDGAPGVRSARYAGEAGRATDNMAKLLRELGDSPNRDAVFATVALARWPDGREIAMRGEVKGAILSEPRGEYGFGYDPVFVPVEGDGRTFAEMAIAEKNALSHRGRAFRALAEALDEKG